MLSERGIAQEFVEVSASTRQCVTVIDESAGQITELVEESQPVESGAFDHLLQIVRKRITGCKAVVMSGTIATGGPADFYLQCTRLARESGALAVVDAQRAPLVEALKANPDVVKPNRAELAATLGMSLLDEPSTMAAMRALHERGARRVIVTSGKAPTLAFDGSAFWQITPPSIKAVNPIGSGDAFTAGVAFRLAAGDDLGEACRWGSAAGAANALTLMAGELSREDVQRLAREVTVEGRPAN
jgi:tagatose 6-phosphate kinase